MKRLIISLLLFSNVVYAETGPTTNYNGYEVKSLGRALAPAPVPSPAEAAGVPVTKNLIRQGVSNSNKNIAYTGVYNPERSNPTTIRDFKLSTVSTNSINNDTYTVEKIAILEPPSDPEAARNTGTNKALRKGFLEVMKRMQIFSPLVNSITSGQINSMVLSMQINDEEFDADGYTAFLNVSFNRTSIDNWLQTMGLAEKTSELKLFAEFDSLSKWVDIKRKIWQSKIPYDISEITSSWAIIIVKTPISISKVKTYLEQNGLSISEQDVTIKGAKRKMNKIVTW